MSARAESGNSAAGFVVSPIYQNVTVSGDQTQPHYVVSLTNTTATDQAFKLSTVDFGSLNNSAGVAFLGTSTSDFAKKYGLSDWMKLDSDAVTVQAGKTVDMGVTINNSSGLTSGGHYGAVLATAQTAPSDKAVQPRVGVFEVLSSLILLIKEPGVTAGMDAVSQKQNGGLWSLPTSVNDQFKNNGNVHVVPRGVVEVKDLFGRVVERGALNVNSGIILPEGTRNYDTPLMNMARAVMVGSYSVVTTYRFDGVTSTKTFTNSFLYLGGWGLVAVVIILLAVLAWSGFVFRGSLKRWIRGLWRKA